MKKAAVKAFISGVLVVAAALTLLVPSLAADTPGKIDYVAFGDSAAAGVLGGAVGPGAALGSDKGYTSNIAALLQEADLLGSFSRDFCTSGMTAKLLARNTAVLRDPATGDAENVRAAEIATLDIGANDLLSPLYDYVGSRDGAVVFDPSNAKDVLTGMIRTLYNGSTGPDIQADIEEILKNILAANASVKIYVMGYYNMLPWVTELLGVDMNEPTEYFNTFIQKAVSAVLAKNPSASVAYVPTFEAMAAPGSLVGGDIHPTESGYRVIAGEFWKHILPFVRTYRVTAAPSATPITADGRTLPFDAYLIGENNYVRLRDVAMALSGTAKQVSVAWDGTSGSVGVTSGQPYSPLGGELMPAAVRTAVPAFLSPCAFYFNGAKLSLTAYLINDSNYIRLRDLARVFNFAVDFNPATGSVTIDTTKDYTAPSR